MFRVIFVNGKVQNVSFKSETSRNLAYEYLSDNSLIYCFNMQDHMLSSVVNLLSCDYETTLLKETYHFAYKKKYYFNENILTLEQEPTIYPLFEKLLFFNNQFLLFFECKHRYERVQEVIYYSNPNEVKEQLIINYEIKKLIPFYYSNRLLKEYISENMIKIKNLSMLYLLEHKTLEGRKR